MSRDTRPVNAKRALLCVLLAPACAFSASGIEIKTAELPPAIKGISYSAPIEVLLDGRCPIDNLRFDAITGALPPGLRLTMSGLAGVPTAMGVFQFNVHAANTCSSFDARLRILVTGKPIMQVFPESINVRIQAGETARRTESVLVSSTWWGLPYLTSDPGERWLSVRPSEGVTPEHGSPLAGDRLVIEIDPTKLEPGVHRQTIRVTAWQAANSVPVQVVVTVLPKP